MMSERKLAQQILKIREKSPSPWPQFTPTTRWEICERRKKERVKRESAGKEEGGD